MTDGQWVGLAVLAAMATPTLWLIPRMVRAYRTLRRLDAEWAALQARVDDARADFEDVRAADRESLIDRIARDMAADLDAEWARENAS